jgi:hypothetical protein
VSLALPTSQCRLAVGLAGQHLIEVGQTTLAGNWNQFLIDS